MAAPDRACDVLIVGAGPTGMTLALLLARAGLDVIAIDRETDVYPLPRAAHVDHEVMRIFQALGVADDIAATCRHAPRYDFLTADGQVLMQFDGLDALAPGGWPAGNMIHQPSLERALRHRAPAFPTLHLQTGWRFESFARTPRGARAAVATPEGPVSIDARWLVGADGARSPVRQSAGIELDDLGFDERWLVIDVLVRDATRLPGVNLQICDPARPTTCVLMGEGRHRWEFMLRPDETVDEIGSDAAIAALLAPWNVDGAVELERKAVYTFGAKMARRWVDGPVILAGDAAHLTPPFAGQGMCAGVRDAANLGWKLPALARGAPGALLDSYGAERAPHVRAFIDLAIMMGRTVCIADPEAARRRDAEMLAARAAGHRPPPSGAPPLSTGCLMAGAPLAGAYFPQPLAGEPPTRLDDALGGGAWLVTRTPTDAIEDVTCVALDAPAVAPFRKALTRWFDAHAVDAVLVRPDRYVFGTGAPETLAAAWRAQTGAPSRAT